MSLFPAYSSTCDKQDSPVNLRQTGNTTSEAICGVDKSWLTNSSFIVEKSSEPEVTIIAEINNDSHASRKQSKKRKDHKHKKRYKGGDEERQNSDSEDEKCRKRKRKKKKKRHEQEKDSEENHSKSQNKGCRFLQMAERYRDSTLIKDDDIFYDDRKRDLRNLSVEKLHRPIVPRYDYSRIKVLAIGIDKNIRLKRSKRHRYYKMDWHGSTAENFFSQATIEEIANSSLENIRCINSEEEISQKTSKFNKRLEEEPHNVQIWLKYIEFQDVACKFERVYRNSTSNSGNKTAIAEKKLSIVEKALSINPLSQDLLEVKVALAEDLFPPGKLKNEALDLLKADPSNLLLWRVVIHNSQYSLARCTAPGTQLAYAEALEQLHRQRRTSTPIIARDVTCKMLVLLFECGLFMRQAGLWEQLLTLLQLYLQLTLAVPGSDAFKFKPETEEQEKQIRDLEDGILQSGLPLSALWLRIERLREACHWIPITSETDDRSDIDPQRIVFSDDVANLLHPITDSSLSFRLVTLAVLLLKVPLLPATDAAARLLQLNAKYSSFDAVENVLAAFYPSGLVPLNTDNHFLKGISELVCGPQYLHDKIGGKEFLDLVSTIMESCGNLLPPAQAVIIYSWYMRFGRFLMCSSAVDGVSPPTGLYQKLKSFAKGLLKKAEFRDELQLYAEYALVQNDFGDVDAAVRVLHTALTLRRFMPDNAPYVALYRNIVETLLRSDPIAKRQAAIESLCSLVECEDVKTATEKFHHIDVEMILNAEKEDLSNEEADLMDVLRPHYLIEWTACHAYFLLLTQSVWAAAVLVEKRLEKILPKVAPFTIGKYVCEGLYEVLINLLHFHSTQTQTSFHVLHAALHRAHSCFPNNVYFLHVMSSIETNAGSAGSPWWKLTSIFSVSNSVLPKIFLIFISRSRISSSQRDGCWTDSSGRNQMEWLLTKLITDDVGMRCPLLWRLCLQFYAVHRGSDEVRRIFYRGIEECPWVKAIYMDAAQLMPESGQEIQDLLIEKELRLHSLLDELNILRSDAV